MRGKRVSSHNWNPTACSAKMKFDNIVIIDVDCDSCENVVVLDVPESIKQKLKGSRRQKGERMIPFHDVISIDDDDEDADLPGPSGTTAGGDGLDSDSISTRRNSVNSNADADADADECCVVSDQYSTSESSDFNNHQSSEHIIGRRFNLSPDLEEDTSEIDFSDCEVIGDSSGDIRQQWEEAFLKRKHDRSDGQVGLGDHARGSTTQCEGGVNKDAHFPDRPMSSPPENASVYGNPFTAAFRNCSFFTQHRSGADQGQVSKENFCPEGGFKSPCNDTGVNVDRDGHSAANENLSFNGEFSFSKEQGPHEFFSSFDQVKIDKENDHITTCFSDEHNKHRSGLSTNNLNQKANVDGEVSAPVYSHLDEHKAVINEEADAPTNKSVLHGLEQIFREQPDNEVPRERKNASTQEQMKEEKSVNEAAFIARSCGERNRNSSDCEAASSVHAIDRDLINGREKLKESYEYKRAIEEEWASRQWQVQLQAEEVQRLRRKKRAEKMRKQDMERRQKQRLDEIRETQKKDVETMNLREQLRAEIRSELSRLELTCFDMASLLRGLGIQVPGQPPLSKEVHAAYKKALLKFHPDRASTKDIHQQVEAEEKFKLISQMKEKFPFT